MLSASATTIRRNVEIKARVTPEQLASILSKVQLLANSGPIELHQDDIYFSSTRGRLKLRVLCPTEGQLIFYERPDIPKPKESQYVIATTPQPAELCEVLTRVCGVAGRVKKTRTLFMVGRTRVHLDKVEGLGGLGHFVELEVVLSEGELPQTGVDVANLLLEELGVPRQQMVAEGYFDLLRGKLRGTEEA